MAWSLHKPTNPKERRDACMRLTLIRIDVAGGFAGAQIPSETISAVRNDPQALRRILSTITASTASEERPT